MSAAEIVVPPARGARGFTRDRLTFAVLVEGIDRTREGAEQLVGERVRGRIAAPVGALLLVYGEDRAPLDGHLRAHMLDLYRIERDGQLRRLDVGGLSGEWLPVALDSIERAQAGVYDQAADEPQEAVPLTLPPGKRLSHRTPLAALLALLLACTALAGPSPARAADVRSTAAWSTTLGRGEWWPLPARVCGGALPTDYEAWSVGTGRRLGDARLFVGLHPRRILGSSYRQVVHAYAWCDPGTGHGLHERRTVPAVPWPMVKLQAALEDASASRGQGHFEQLPAALLALPIGPAVTRVSVVERALVLDRRGPLRRELGERPHAAVAPPFGLRLGERIADLGAQLDGARAYRLHRGLVGGYAPELGALDGNQAWTAWLLDGNEPGVRDGQGADGNFEILAPDDAPNWRVVLGSRLPRLSDVIGPGVAHRADATHQHGPTATSLYAISEQNRWEARR